MYFFGIVLGLSVLLTISKFAMEIIKKRDRRNGLVLDDKYYSITGTLFSPLNQDKRLKKIQKLKFENYNIDDKQWKKGFIFFIILGIAGLLYAIIYNADVLSIVFAAVFVVLLFFVRKIIFLVLLDMFVIYGVLHDFTSLNISVCIIFPAVIMINYIVMKDYMAYRKKINQNDKNFNSRKEKRENDE